MPKTASVRAAMQAVAAYDSLRLRAYQRNFPHPQDLAVEQHADRTTLRFSQVGYFNRTYLLNEQPQLDGDALERFYRDSSFGFEVVAHDSAATALQAQPQARAWQASARHAWLWADLANTTTTALGALPSGWQIRPPLASEQSAFCEVYLQAFEAAPHRHAAAMANMRLLFEQPQLHALMAFDQGQPVGVALTYLHGNIALLSAGATLPPWRQRGLHRRLIAERLHQAKRWGAQHAVSWALAGGRSHANLQHLGLRTLGHTQSWRAPARTQPLATHPR